METIEERAREYAHQYRRDAHDLKGERADAAFAAYCQGAEDERKELTHWHDPKEELPEYYKAVEIKHRRSGLIRISTAWMSAGDAGGYLWTIDGTNVLVNVKNVIGWREIL